MTCDAAGQAAALRSLDILGSRGIKVTVLQVPEGKDPDEYIRRNGPERFHALLEKALPLLDFKLLVARRRQHGRRMNLDILAYQDAACQILAREENAIVRELYANRLAEELNASAETVLREIERRHQNPDRPAADPGSAAPEAADLQQPAVQCRITPNHAVPGKRFICLACWRRNPDIWAQIAAQASCCRLFAGAMQDRRSAPWQLAAKHAARRRRADRTGRRDRDPGPAAA